jgi:triphosphoribosyl-dephospho-CoA synthase
LPLGLSATLAILWEVSAPKPGNVHRGADFEDVGFVDFAAAAAAVGPAIAAAPRAGVGATVLAGVWATRQVARSNTNLGTLLLMAPLACVPRDAPLRAGVAHVLESLTPADARDVYAAIGLAEAGGLGQVERGDIRDEPPPDLLAAMGWAADRDLVARQYVNRFADVLDHAAPRLATLAEAGWALADAIVRVQLELLSREPDSLIVRKCGPVVGRQASDWAAELLALGAPGDEAYHAGLADFDFWLRADGHRRNPGTTADLIAAALFALVRAGVLRPPARFHA